MYDRSLFLIQLDRNFLLVIPLRFRKTERIRRYQHRDPHTLVVSPGVSRECVFGARYSFHRKNQKKSSQSQSQKVISVYRNHRNF
jgi:hypothetical protein